MYDSENDRELPNDSKTRTLLVALVISGTLATAIAGSLFLYRPRPSQAQAQVLSRGPAHDSAKQGPLAVRKTEIAQKATPEPSQPASPEPVIPVSQGPVFRQPSLPSGSGKPIGTYIGGYYVSDAEEYEHFSRRFPVGATIVNDDSGLKQRERWQQTERRLRLLEGDPDPIIRGIAAASLVAVESEDPRFENEAIPALRKALQDKNQRVRERAAWALKWLGKQ